MIFHLVKKEIVNGNKKITRHSVFKHYDELPNVYKIQEKIIMHLN